MANRYWVGGTATWDATAGTKWATTSGGAGGAATPTAADDVFLDGASGAVTVSVGAGGTSVCRSLDCTGFTGTLSHGAGLALIIGDSTAGAGNVALRLSAGMTFTVGNTNTSVLQFTSISATQQTLTFSGKTTGQLVFATAGSWIFNDAWTGAGTNTNLTHTAGIVNTNGQALSMGALTSNNTNVRTLTLGSSLITIVATGTAWNTGTTTGLTFNANTSTITANGASATLNSGALAFNNLSFTGSGVSTLSVTTGTSFNTLSRIGTAVKTDSFSIFVSGGSLLTVSSLVLTGNSVTNRMFVQSSVVGATRTITVASASLTNVDFMDITGAGAASWTGASLGDCLGNSNITFDTPTTQTNTGATGNWSDATKWTSRVPLPQDNVVINTGSGVITADMPRMGKSIDFTGFTGTLSRSLSSTS
jgi:hypothetical protein